MSQHFLEKAMSLLAALCLHDQPFGFTREDVEALRTAIQDHWSEYGGGAFPPEAESPFYALLTSLADRIEALLPPEDV